MGLFIQFWCFRYLVEAIVDLRFVEGSFDLEELHSSDPFRKMFTSRHLSSLDRYHRRHISTRQTSGFIPSNMGDDDITGTVPSELIYAC